MISTVLLDNLIDIQPAYEPDSTGGVKLPRSLGELISGAYSDEPVINTIRNQELHGLAVCPQRFPINLRQLKRRAFGYKHPLLANDYRSLHTFCRLIWEYMRKEKLAKNINLKYPLNGKIFEWPLLKQFFALLAKQTRFSIYYYYPYDPLDWEEYYPDSQALCDVYMPVYSAELEEDGEPLLEYLGLLRFSSRPSMPAIAYECAPEHVVHQAERNIFQAITSDKYGQLTGTAAEKWIPALKAINKYAGSIIASWDLDEAKFPIENVDDVGSWIDAGKQVFDLRRACDGLVEWCGGSQDEFWLEAVEMGSGIPEDQWCSQGDDSEQ